jgi:Arc/MetJ family transcription regulator
MKRAKSKKGHGWLQVLRRPFDSRKEQCNTICMKRTSLTLDEHLLEDALRLGGERTYSKTVEKALELFVRRIKARQILDLGHSGLWRGDLAEMRRDAPNVDQRPR